MKKYELRSGVLKEEVVESVDSGTPTPVRKKMITAYILFSTDMRKITVDENPGVRFGEISRIMAERWRAMTDADKQQYAERAKKVNEDKEEKRLPLVGGAMKKYELRSGLLKEEVVESVDSGTHT